MEQVAWIAINTALGPGPSRTIVNRKVIAKHSNQTVQIRCHWRNFLWVKLVSNWLCLSWVREVMWGYVRSQCVTPELQMVVLRALAAWGLGKRNPEWVGGGENEIIILLCVFIRLWKYWKYCSLFISNSWCLAGPNMVPTLFLKSHRNGRGGWCLSTQRERKAVECLRQSPALLIPSLMPCTLICSTLPSVPALLCTVIPYLHSNEMNM